MRAVAVRRRPLFRRFALLALTLALTLLSQAAAVAGSERRSEPQRGTHAHAEMPARMSAQPSGKIPEKIPGKAPGGIADATRGKERGGAHRVRGHEAQHGLRTERSARGGKARPRGSAQARYRHLHARAVQPGGGVAIDSASQLALITDESGDAVRMVALPAGDIIGSVPLRGSPRDVAIDGGRRLAAVSLRARNRLALFTLPEMQSVAQIDIGGRPGAVALDPHSGLAAVIDDGGDLVRLVDVDRRRATGKIRAGKQPRDLAMQEGEHRIWVSLAGERAVAVIDAERGRTLARIAVGKEPAGVAVSTRLRLAAVANSGDGTLSLIDIDTLRETHRVRLRGQPLGVAIDEDAAQVLVTDHAGASLWLIDAREGMLVDRIAVDRHPGNLALDPAARVALLVHRHGDIGIVALPELIALTMEIDFPPEGWATREEELVVRGVLNRATTLSSDAAALSIDGVPVAVDEDGRFVHRIVLGDGSNLIELLAVDEAGNVFRRTLSVVLDRDPPGAPVAGLISVSSAAGGQMHLQGAAGSVEPRALVRVTNLRTGVTASVLAEADGSFSLRLAGLADDRYLIHASDGVGNEGVATEVGGEDLPPDPSAIAPPLPAGATASFADAVAFLRQGARPVQRELGEGIIDAERVAVLRGRVLSASGAPLPGVTIRVRGQAEYGHTATRADGVFDLMVNGGGAVVIDYARAGHLPVQRRVRVPQQEFAWLPDVVMLAPDSQLTSIVSGAPAVQIARGSRVSDADGERQATVIFPANTRAELVFADGTIVSPERLSIRATEYTRSEFGTRTMPGELPPTSAWTYAVELSADEALAAGADAVRFDRPVSVWVENFPGFPVGGAVPSAWYERTRAAWMPDDDGRVIGIVDVVDGMALLDLGDGAAADPQALEALGIDDEERLALGLLYQPGVTLWRVPVRHFTPWDFNWPHGPPPDAVAPDVVIPQADVQQDDPDCRRGSIIECENQVLAEALDLAGTGQALHYRSDRVPGRRSARSLDIPLSGATVPASLQRIELELTIAGRQFRQSYAPAPGLRHAFVWDGRDAYGRLVHGASRLSVRIGYVYQTIYFEPASAPRSFSLPGIRPLFGVDRLSTFTVWTDHARILGGYDARAAGLGGWTLTAHHAFDRIAGILHRGDGTRRTIGGFAAVISTFAGGVETGFSGDGGPATAARLGRPAGLAVGADGSVYLADGAFFASDTGANRRVRRIAPNGVITTLAGGGSALGDGGPAALAQLAYPADVAVGPDGSIYIADAGMPDRSDPAAHRIRRVYPDGTIVTVAGIGEAGFSGDGGPATEARLNAPMGIAVGADGSLYIADWINSRIRRVGPDGIITTLAGNGVWGFGGDGGPAIHAQIRSPAGIAVAADGSVYFSDWSENRLRRIGVDGIIRTVAGGAVFADPGADGVPGLQARLLQPAGIAIDRDGGIYIADQSGARLRRLGPDGILTTVAGNGASRYTGDGGPARAAQLANPTGVAIGADGSVYVAEHAGRIRRIAEPAHLRAPDGTLTVPSPEGRELYRFDRLGRHLATLDTVSGALLYRFEHDDAGRLLAMEDRDGRTIAIARDAGGDPLAIETPAGMRTALTVDGQGWLATFVAPDGAGHALTHTPQGLLTGVRRPLGGVSAYEYDAAGYLRAARDPLGAGPILTRAQQTPRLATVTVSSAEGVATVYRVEELPNGGQVRSTAVAGNEVMRTVSDVGGQTITATDGTVTVLRERPDPRFGLEAPATDITVTTPAGITARLELERSVELIDPADPLSHASIIERTTVDGARYESHYSAAERRWTLSSPSGRTAFIALDARGRVLARSAAGLAPISQEYDSQGHLVALSRGTGSEARRWLFEYEAGGRLSALSDPLSRRIVFDYDAAGRLSRQFAPDGHALSYIRDAEGRLASLAAPDGGIHDFTWAANGLAERYLPPANAATIHRTHDLDRRPAGITLGTGVDIGFSYDAAGRPASMTLARGRYEYAYDAGNRPLHATAPDGTGLAWTWDGFLPLTETLDGEVRGTVNWRWGDGFALREMQIGNHALAFGHDADGLLTLAGDMRVVRDTASGLPTELSLGELVALRGYNAFGEPASLEVTHGGLTLARFDWARDALGRVTGVSENVQGEVRETGYAYAESGRLAAVERDGVVTGMSHDSVGNLTHRNGVPVAEYDESGRLLRHGAEQFTYDDTGALALRSGADGDTRFEYDALGNLLRVELADGRVIEYLVDARNRRVGRRIDGALSQGFLYGDDLRPVAELDGSNAVRSVFVYGDRLNVPAYMVRDGRTYFIVSDHLGSPRLVVDAADGQVAQRIDYDVHGRIVRDTNPGFQPFGFAGGLYDHDTGLLRFGARDYDPRVGRWTSPDPLGLAGGAINPYVYAGGDPVNFIDPHGTFVLNAAGAAVGAAVGALMAAATGEPIVAGLLGGALAGAFPGGGVMANLAVGAVSGVAADLVSRWYRRCESPGSGPGINMLSGMVGSALGRYLGMLNGVLVARAGEGAAKMFDQSSALVSAYYAQTVTGSMIGGGAAVLMRPGDAR